jgi:hypothetical protein
MRKFPNKKKKRRQSGKKITAPVHAAQGSILGGTPLLDSRLAAVIVAASVLSLGELGQLDKWLCARIADEKAKAGEIFSSPSRIVVEERKARDITYRLEFVKCGKASCRKCRRGPAHGPYWYAYGRGSRRARNKYIGKTLDPQALAASVPLDKTR